MGQGSNSLHFNGVSLFQGVIKNTWRVDHLPSHVVIIGMSDEKTLGGKGIRLDVNISTGDIVHKGRFTDIGETRDQEGSFIRVDTWETAHVFSDFFQKAERSFELLSHGGHASQGSFLKHLAPVEGIGVFHKSYVIFADVVDQRSGCVDVPQSQLVMVLVIKHVDQSRVERVDVVSLGEILEHFR